MLQIQSLQAAHFRARFELRTEADWGYWDPNTGYYSGKTTEEVSYAWVTLLTLEPGLVVGGQLPTSYFDSYCQNAKKRAVDLYRAADMTSARSAAVADVSGLDSNWIENLSQVKGTSSVINPLMMARDALSKGDLDIARKAFSSAYLAYKYVIAPGISDYHDVKDNGGNVLRSISKYRFSNERRRGRVSSTSPVLTVTANLDYFCTYHLQLKDSSFAEVWNALERLGLDPSANNLWDLIPLSFIADWFSSIGPALDKISAYNNNVLTRDIKSRIESFKVQWPLTEEELVSELLTDYSVSTPLLYNWYDRRLYANIGSVDPFAGQSNDGLSVSQMAQGAALLSVYR